MHIGVDENEENIRINFFTTLFLVYEKKVLDTWAGTVFFFYSTGLLNCQMHMWLFIRVED